MDSQKSTEDEAGQGLPSGLRATTIGTVVVRGGPIQMVIALLQLFKCRVVHSETIVIVATDAQTFINALEPAVNLHNSRSGDTIHIKVVEIEPKFTTLGENIDETIGLQRDHDELLKQMQGMPTPVEEFIRKADKLLASKRINSHVSDAMGQALNIIWEDILKLVHDRKHLIDLCANFHERMGSCRGKMASLEVACKDTMIPIEVDAVQDFLNKFKQLRIDVLSIIMSALKDGNALLASLQEIAQAGTLDTRPDHIKRDAVRAVSQVQQWLENLHDRRNALETAWQTRKTQLEQCLALAILAKDLDELENVLMNRKNETSGIFNLGECEHTANTSLQDYIGFKHDALLLRDRALKITRTTEKLVSGGNFAGDESCSRAYNVLSHCTEYLELVDQREHWLNQSKEFFSKAEKTLGVLEKLEIELSTVKVPQKTPENFAMYTKILKDMRAFTEEPLRLGYALLDDVGRTIPETQGIKRVLDEIENRKIYIEGMCSSSTEEQVRVTQALNSFLQLYNEILSWLVSVAEAFLKTNNVVGGNLEESKNFLHLHHKLMQDLEIKGETINIMLENIKQFLDSLDTQQRYDVDTKAESLHRNWIELKELVLKRVDLVSLYIDFLQKAQNLSNKFDDIEQNLKETPEEKKLQHLEEAWNDIKASYGNLKAAGMRFLNLKVADPYLETKSACSSVEEILNSFSNRQFDITSSWEKWTTSIVESKEIQIILEKIMNEQIEVLKKTTTLDAQLYPVFVSSSEEPKQLKNETESKLEIVFDDIEKAQSELLQRMNTATNVHAKDVELQEKVDQVASNLLSLKNKLDNIKYDYRSLVESLLNFLDNIISLRSYMDDYFLEKQIINDTETSAATVTVVDVGKISRDLADHESFRENVMDKFRSLISQSEKLIDRVRVLEPPGAREHDTDRILKLLENLRIHFESNNDRKMSELQKSQLLTSFDRELNEIHNNLDSVTGQLDDIKEQKIETSAAAKTTSLAFEYFERTIELLEKRIENFIKSSENIYATNPDAEPYVTGETEKLKEKWELLKGQVKNTRNSLNLTNDYYELYIQVESQLRELSSFHSHAVNKIPHLQNSVEASNIINDIEQCINNHENPLNSKLHQLKSLSLKLYNDDKTSSLQNDVGTLIQSFTRLKFDVSQIVDRLRNEEKQRDLKDQVDHDVVMTETKTDVVTVFSEIKYTSPKFVKQLNDAEIVEGEKLTFECEVAGNPEPTIEWFKDGISIQNNLDYRTHFSNGLCSLSIEETFAADSAKFMCRASNLVGSDETFAILTIKEHASDEQLSPPKVLRYLKSGTAQEGSPFEFLCIVNGNPLPTVQWFKDDKCIDDSPDYIINYNNGEAILKFEKVYLEDRAIYTCKATNSVGFEQCSAKLSIEPLEPTEEPHFKVHLSNVMARVGQKIKLESVVAGIPTPELFWTHNGKPFNSRDAKYENERVTLIISEAFPKDAGIYVLTARNLAGEAYSSCNVTVKGRLPNETSDSEMASDIEPIKPSVQLPLKNISVFEGKSVRLDCVIIGQPEPEVIWYHNDRPVKESADVQLLFQGDRCSLVIQEAYLEDAGSYKVVAINSAGEAASSCALTVTPLNLAEPATRIQNDRAVSADGQPKFDKFLTDVLAAEGDTVDLECSVSGDISNLSVKWFLSNKELSQSDRIQFVTDNEGVFKLVIKNVSVNDKGVYTIKVSNPNGDAKCFSHLIVKSVNAPENQNTQMEIEERLICPSFKELFSDKNAHNEDLVKFECIVVGKPTPKIKWLFNEQPVHGKNFLISTSGDRQVLTIPSVSVETVGKIACVAENEIGRATCVAHLSLIGDGSLPSTVDIQSMSQEHNAESSKVTIKKQTFTTTSTSQVSTIEGNIPHIELNGSAASFEHNFQQLGQQAPEIVESRHYQEFHKTNDAPSSIQQKSIILVTKPEELPRQKLTRKESAPRFVSPLVGKIVDQGCNVTLEAIYDGFPSPEVKVLKNGDELFNSDRVKILNKVNKITIDVADVNVRDAGRYSITVSNTAGSSTSTADIVVKKSIFPPVFGRRLQAQMAKRGERIIMEVEITGTPDPTVMWYKDGKPLAEVQLSQYKIKSEGNTHRLIIEKAKVEDSGKFMVKATNSGGEAQSLADFAVLEPTPERMVEVVKTVVYDDLKDFASETKNPEIQSFHTSKTEHKTESDLHGTAETSIITEHRCRTEATMRLEHKPTYLDLPEMKNKTPTPASNLEQKSVSTTTEIQKSKIGGTQIQAAVPLKIQTDSSSVESSSISKKSAFEYFKKIQVEPLSPADEKYMKYDEYSKTPTPTFSPPPSAPPPPAGPKYGWAPVRPAPPTSTSVPTFIPIQKEESVSFTDPSLISLNLKPGTPPEIGYIPPKPETSTREHISDRIKKLEESQSHNFEAPSGGIQVLPQITKKQEYTSTSFVKETKFDTSSGPIFRPQAVLPTPIVKDRSPSPLPSAEGVAMQKLWASPKPFEHQESYQSTQSFQTKIYSAPQEEVKPEPQPEEQNIQSIKETKKMFEQKIQQSSTTTSWSAPAVELKSPHLVKQFYTKPEPSKPAQEKLVDIHLEPGTPPEICFAPIPAEGERRQSLVEAMEKSLEKNLMNEPKKVLPCSVRTIPPIKKDTPPPLPPKDFHISAPPLPTRPVIVEKQFKPPPPAFPPKIVRTEYSESEYESDKWKYSESESDEPVYRSVKAPQGVPVRPKSFEQPVLPPSQFETPLSEQKFKTKTSGYTADTEESFYRKFESKTVQESRQVFESKQTTKSSFPVSVPTTKVVPPAPRVAAPSQSQQKDFRSSSFTKNVSMTTKQAKVEGPQQFPFKPDSLKPKQQKIPPPPSPSKFIKGEFRDTEYNSDYEERIQPLWKPFDADAEVKGYRPVRPNFTPTERRSTNLSEEFISPAPAAEYYHTPRNDGPPSRPKFEPIKHEAPIKTQTQPHVYKPKPVSAKFIETSHTATPQKSYTTQYYTAVAGAPQHHASVATETRNTMQMKESSETCHRVVNMSQTKRVIHFDQHKINQQTALEPFPYSPSPATTASPRPHTGPTPTPTKFIPGEYRESDYESEVEGARIRPLWTPNPSDYDEPRYRRVNPPRPSRSVSLPRSYERVYSPMEFDTGPPEMPSKISVVSSSPQYNQYRSQTLDRYSRASSQKSTKDDMNLKVGSPPKFGYIQENAQNQFNNINTTFRKKTNQFINDVSNDVKSQQAFRPGFKRAPSEGDNKPQAYREESRLSQYGTKHVDPNTGLIYFKYDFGYEFGIIFPGEGKKFIGGVRNNKLTNTSTNSRYPLKQNDIVIPVQHERSTPKSFNQNGFTSESEFSETEYDAHAKKRYSLPITISVDDYHKNDRNFHNGVAAAEYPYNGVPVNAQNNREERPKRPPIFITPLKDIAVVIAQTARFECIVQCDPYPKIVWSKNGFPLHHSNKHLIEFRNGVCRLTIPEAYPDDAGTYSCAGTNELGTATTTADLIVPGNKLGTRY